MIAVDDERAVEYVDRSVAAVCANLTIADMDGLGGQCAIQKFDMTGSEVVRVGECAELFRNVDDATCSHATAGNRESAVTAVLVAAPNVEPFRAEAAAVDFGGACDTIHAEHEAAADCVGVDGHVCAVIPEGCAGITGGGGDCCCQLFRLDQFVSLPAWV